MGRPLRATDINKQQIGGTLEQPTPARLRISLVARELAQLTGRHIAEGNHIATYAGDARAEHILPAHPDVDRELDETELDLLGDFVAAQLTLARYAAANLASGIYAEAHAHLGMAQTCSDPWRCTMHLRIVETAAAMILAAMNKREHEAAIAARAEARQTLTGGVN